MPACPCRPGTCMKFTYTGIEVKDLDKSIAFYRDVVGMEYLGRGKIEATGGEVAALKSAGSEHTLELNWYPDSRYRGGNELDHLAFEGEAGRGPTQIRGRLRQGSGRHLARTVSGTQVRPRRPTPGSRARCCHRGVPSCWPNRNSIRSRFSHGQLEGRASWPPLHERNGAIREERREGKDHHREDRMECAQR